MTGCIVLGDSIALGVAAFAQLMVPGGCHIYARVGARTAEIARMAPQDRSMVAFVSAGSNDRGNRLLAGQLSDLRAKVHAAHIVWLYPRERVAAWAVYSVARAGGDRTISVARLTSRDGIHPNDYRAAAAMIFRPR